MRLKLLFIALCGFAVALHAQSTLAISSGASVTVSEGADICVDTIIGPVQGDGTICGGLNSIEPGTNNPLPIDFALEQNYPNPFNPATTLSFTIPHSSFTLLKVFDILGREVATLVNELKTPGRYEIEWNTKGAASGVYIYRLEAGNYIETRKMILLR